MTNVGLSRRDGPGSNAYVVRPLWQKLTSLEGILNPVFTSLASAALPLERPLYLHQEQAIRKITAGRNVIVASGTGSGKPRASCCRSRMP